MPCGTQRRGSGFGCGVVSESIREQLTRWHAAGVRAVRPDLLLAECGSLEPDRWVFRRGTRELGLCWPDRAAGGRLRVIALGKAGRTMANGFLESLRRAKLPGEVSRVDAGLIITRDAWPGDPPWREIFGDHPYPGERSLHAAHELLAFIGQPSAADRFLVLLSGGASALCALPIEGMTLEEKRAATRELMLSGAPIETLNRLRARLSAIKGGKLAQRMAPAQVITLAVSDVAGDDPAIIGSGPTYDPPQAPCLVIAGLDDALVAIETAARAEGVEVCNLGRTLYGQVEEEARRVARTIAAAPPASRPRLWLAGGEPVVTVRGTGRGGRAQELALRLAAEVAAVLTPEKTTSGVIGRPVAGLAAGTDGADGPTPAAGGFFDSSSTVRIAAAGIDLAGALARNDSHAVLGAVGDQFVTGPTGTNVADVLLVLESPR